MSKRFLLLLSGNLSTTPRAVKIIKMLRDDGHEVDIMMMNRLDKWKKLDGEILPSLGCKFSYLPLQRKENFSCWFFAGIIQRIARVVSSVFKKNITLNSLATAKTNVIYWLYRNRLRNLYDMIWGFSSMFYPAYLYSRRWEIPFSFDMEDYHPGESYYSEYGVDGTERIESLLCDILPLSSFVTFASPLIENKTIDLFKSRKVNCPLSLTVNNTFDRSDFHFEECISKKMSFVWFSQTVSYGRGLELVLPALSKFKDKLSLTIIGNMDKTFYDDVLATYSDFLFIKGPLPQSELHSELCRYDVGLAIELVKEINRGICLTNKIFSYLLAGLYVFATDTKAQKQLIDSLPGCGVVVNQDSCAMEKGVEAILKDMESIRREKFARFSRCSDISWENEQKKLKMLF